MNLAGSFQDGSFDRPILTIEKPNDGIILIKCHKNDKLLRWYIPKTYEEKIAVILKETDYPNIYFCLIDNEKKYVMCLAT